MQGLRLEMGDSKGGYLVPEPVASILIDLWEKKTPGNLYPVIMDRLGYEKVDGEWTAKVEKVRNGR